MTTIAKTIADHRRRQRHRPADSLKVAGWAARSCIWDVDEARLDAVLRDLRR